MIELEITDSPDKDILGKRTYYFDQISIGSGLGSTAIISESKLEAIAIIMEVGEKGVEVDVGEAEFYLSNGKKIYEGKLHKEGDIIVIGQTTIKVVSYSKTDMPRSDLESVYQKTIEEDPSREGLFNELKQELATVEKQLDDKV